MRPFSGKVTRKLKENISISLSNKGFFLSKERVLKIRWEMRGNFPSFPEKILVLNNKFVGRNKIIIYMEKFKWFYSDNENLF
jgi:hypothetical protein